jgi:hypothetical protein
MTTFLGTTTDLRETTAASDAALEATDDMGGQASGITRHELPNARRGRHRGRMQLRRRA